MATGPARSAAALVLLAGAILPARAEEPAPAPAPLVVRKWLALDPVDTRGRVPFNRNAPFARYLLDRGAPPPKAGEVVKGDRGEKPWRAIEAKEDGTVEDEEGAWFWASLDVEEGGVFLARLDGAGALFVNGAGFVGDVYRGGFGPVPVALRKGANGLFVAGPRGPWRLSFERWTEGRSPVLPEDATIPDAVAGDSPDGAAAFRVVNPEDRWVPGDEAPRIEAEGGPYGMNPPHPPDGRPAMAPLWTGKVPVDLAQGPMPQRAKGKEIRFQVGAWRTAKDGAVRAGPALPFLQEVRDPREARRVTFTSGVDGSVQFFGCLPPAPADTPPERIGTVLTLHGASVDALGQARCYSAKPDFRIVAPTNRRPFGFDWQDWGRVDALEVLDEALRMPRADPGRVFLTGHSMGGHGAWHLAANAPDLFAAIAPSAGWCSFDTYGGGPRPESPLTPLWRACDGGSRTEDLVSNLVGLPTFVLHGTEDDNVPLSEAEGMLERLAKAGAKPDHHFQAGAGHWWDGDAAPGTDCVDWPGIFDLFRRSRRDPAPAAVDFTTFLQGFRGEDLRRGGILVRAPQEYGRPVRIRATRADGRVTIATENARALAVEAVETQPLVAVTLDGQEAARDLPAGTKEVVFRRKGDAWRRVTEPSSGIPGDKGLLFASGPFKRAFDNGFLLVVGTKGTEEENREMLELARYHAGQWWYRANGGAAVVRDADLPLLPEPSPIGGRNLILYGNADTNAAWAAAIRDGCPLSVRRGEISLGGRTWKGGDLGALLVYPRVGGRDGLVGAFASTGSRGTRLGYGLLPFVSGVGYPDYAVFGPAFLADGDGGVFAAGWFDDCWRLQAGAYEREGGAGK